MNISGNTILITGGTSGIGLAFAEAFINAGNIVIICGRRNDRLLQLNQKYPELITRVCDVSLQREREELAEWAIENFPDLNVVMNNSGVQYASDLQNSIDMDKVISEINTNLVAPIQLSSLFIKHLSSKENGTIINISSGLAFVPIAFMPVYCATKAAIHSFTISLRYQLKNTSIKVFEIAPPSVDTELGHDRRVDKTQSHGGLPVDQFLKEAMEALDNDIFEAPIADSKFLKEKGMDAFEGMNARF